MADQGDALRTARALLRIHGRRAEDEARELWSFYRDCGATNAARVWKRVMTAIAALRSERDDRVLH